jgi:hemolysin III
MEEDLSFTTSSSSLDFSFKKPLKRIDHLPEEEKWAQGLLLGDEWANSLTHGIGLILSIIGFIFLIANPLQAEDHWKLLNFAVYGGSLILLYAASTCYHAIKRPQLKKVLRLVDHCAIYLLIAGTYTPFTIFVLEGVWGWTLFTIVWGLACLGITFKTLFKHRFSALSTTVYLLMGWMVIIAAEPLMSRFHISGLCWVLAGGLCYTLGVIFYILDKRRFYHAIWHLFVLVGSFCHYCAIFFYI